MRLNDIKCAIILLLPVILISGCASLRTEFFRGESRYLYSRGCQHYKQGDYAAAREAFKKVLALDPNYGQAHGALGNIALAERAHTAALTHYRRAIQADPDLEDNLRPFILLSTVQVAREPITKAGTDLRQVYRLIMADRLAELESLLSKAIPLDLLARDTLSITASEIGELQTRVTANADPTKGSVRYRLFTAYFLFYSQAEPVLAAALIEQAAKDAESEDRKKAFMILGQIRERLGDFNLAVDAYLMAVKAGLPLTEVADHLSRIYGLDAESVLVKSGKPEPGSPLPRPLRIDVSLPVRQHPAMSDMGFEETSSGGTLNLLQKNRSAPGPHIF